MASQVKTLLGATTTYSAHLSLLTTGDGPGIPAEERKTMSRESHKYHRCCTPPTGPFVLQPKKIKLTTEPPSLAHRPPLTAIQVGWSSLCSQSSQKK